MIYFTSDLHLGHDQEFIWGARGFNSVTEMNEKIISRWNSRITKDDDVYILGDLVMGGVENVELLKQLNGKIHIIYGNHDGPKKREAYAELENVVECGWANMIKYKKYNFYLSHYPTITDNYNENSLKQKIINLCGHSHTCNWNEDMDKGLIYHCDPEAHNCYPISIDQIIEDLKTYFNLN